MSGFWKSRRGLIVAIALVIAAAAAVAMQIERRYTARQERETQERIKRDVQQSIDKATGGLKLCPLSNPDCNKR